MNIFYYFVIIFASLFVLLKSADVVISSISRYAKKLGLGDYLIGLVVVAMASSMPEVVSSLIGVLNGNQGIFLGTILGTNLVHMALIVGFLSVFSKKIKVECKILDNFKLFVWFLVILPFILMSDGLLSRSDGLLLVIVFCVYIVLLWRKEGTFGRIKKNVALKTIYKDMLLFLLGVVVLIVAGYFLVFAVINVSLYFSIPSFLVALFVIGIGGALPDFVVGVKSIVKMHQEIGVGDILGSTIIELCLFFGILALIKPFEVDFGSILNAGFFIVLSSALLLFFIKKKSITWKQGLLSLFCYFAFVIIEIWRIM